jgi:endonuclease YncB( thermonuclease family)
VDSPEYYEAGYQEAKDHLTLLIEDKPVTCLVLGKEFYGRLLAEGRTDDTPDLGEEMLRSGHAIRYSSRYHGLQAECRKGTD